MTSILRKIVLVYILTLWCKDCMHIAYVLNYWMNNYEVLMINNCTDNLNTIFHLFKFEIMRKKLEIVHSF